jgi:hypothetical protein
MALALGCGYSARDLAVDMEDICGSVFQGAKTMNDLAGDARHFYKNMRVPLVDSTNLRDAIQGKLISKLRHSLKFKAEKSGKPIEFDEHNACLKDIKQLNPNLRVMVTLL